MSRSSPVALKISDVESTTGTIYPEPFARDVAGRRKRALGNAVGLKNFGVVYVELAPGAWSAQRHWHTREDEFVYVVQGRLTLVTDDGRTELTPGMVAGFPAGREDGHHLVNDSDSEAAFIVVGDRQPDDEGHYPDIDLQYISDDDGKRYFAHKDGSPY